MTFNSPRHLLLLLGLVAPLAWAGLGEAEGGIEVERAHMHAQHAVQRAALYSVHELKMQDGSRVRQYVSGSGRVFAVSWSTFFKPDMATLLGTSFPSYSNAEHVALQRRGIQRQFHHEGPDLVVQSTGHMNVYHGFAYRPSLVPAGLPLQTLGLG